MQRVVFCHASASSDARSRCRCKSSFRSSFVFNNSHTTAEDCPWGRSATSKKTHLLRRCVESLKQPCQNKQQAFKVDRVWSKVLDICPFCGDASCLQRPRPPPWGGTCAFVSLRWQVQSRKRIFLDFREIHGKLCKSGLNFGKTWRGMIFVIFGILCKNAHFWISYKL